MHFLRLRFEKIKLDHPFCYGDTHLYQKKVWSKCKSLWRCSGLKEGWWSWASRPPVPGSNLDPGLPHRVV